MYELCPLLCIFSDGGTVRELSELWCVVVDVGDVDVHDGRVAEW